MKLSYFTQRIQRDRITCTELFKNMDNRLIGIWDRAVRASANLVDVDKDKQIKINYWFEIEYDEDSATFKDIAYEANFSKEETDLFRKMVETAIEHQLLVNVSEEPEIKQLNIKNAYCFKEVWDTVNAFIKIDYPRQFGRIKALLPEEEKKLMDEALSILLSKYSPKNKEHIQRFLSETAKVDISLLQVNKRGNTLESFEQWIKENSIKLNPY